CKGLKWLERPLWWELCLFTWGLVIVGASGTGAAVWTLITIRRQAVSMEDQLREMRGMGQQTERMIRQAVLQAGATRKMAEQAMKQTEALASLASATIKSADAAELTAKRLAQVEGARIIVIVEWLPGLGKFVDLGDDSNPATGVILSVRCVNEGKSTAWITEVRHAVRIFENTIPHNPDFEDTHILFHGFQEVGQDASAKWDNTPECSGFRGVGKWILTWGIVKYRDMFSDTRETTF